MLFHSPECSNRENLVTANLPPSESDIEDELPDAASPEEEQFTQQLGMELDVTSRELSTRTTDAGASSRENKLQSWQVAGDLVGQFRPVPWIVWKLIRSALGKPGRIVAVNPINFEVVDKIVYQSLSDKVLGKEVVPSVEIPNVPFPKAVEIVGPDVIAATCFIHCCCRRIASRVSEKVWRPIIDDALLRARFGYHAGEASSHFGAGRGMLAGFAGRLGLAVQISSADIAKTQHALEQLAKGVGMSEVGLSVYGCDPLQVSALSLTAAGCSRDAALGTAAYSVADESLDPESDQFKWFAAFSIVEHLRMGSDDAVLPEFWKALDLTEAPQERLRKHVKAAQRRGSGWQWMTWPLTRLKRPGELEQPGAEPAPKIEQ